MNPWKQRIVAAFVEHYFASAPKTGEEKRAVLRLRQAVFFPGFEAAPPDEKESYLEAAEALERKGLVKITWGKRDQGERIKTISCADFEKLFTEAGDAYPQAEAEKIRAMLGEAAARFRLSVRPGVSAPGLVSFLDYLRDHFGPRETAQGMDQKAADEFVRLLEKFFDPPELEKISTRALSILLYRDSKRLESLLALFAAALSQAKKQDVPVPDFSFLERSYPDTMIAGTIILEYQESGKPPLVNASGLILGLPLESVETIGAIKPVAAKERPAVLIIENKETFYALASPQKYGVCKNLSRYDCFLFSGGYPNRAAAALIKTLAASGFDFYHAGDLDPGGILILQNIRSMEERPVTPVMMNAAVFDRYLPWARTLGKGSLRQLRRISGDTRAIPGLAELIRRIEETGCGVEQEIVDYRGE